MPSYMGAVFGLRFYQYKPGKTIRSTVGYTRGPRGWTRVTEVQPSSGPTLTGGLNKTWHSPIMTAECELGHFVKGPVPHDSHLELYLDHLGATSAVPLEWEAKCGINMYSIDGLFIPNSSVRMFIKNMFDNDGSSYAKLLARHFGVRNTVLGLSRGTGKIVVHQDGYRVEHCSVEMLLTSESVAEFYNPPTDQRSTFEKGKGKGVTWDSVPVFGFKSWSDLVDHLCDQIVPVLPPLTQIPESETLQCNSESNSAPSTLPPHRLLTSETSSTPRSTKERLRRLPKKLPLLRNLSL